MKTTWKQGTGSLASVEEDGAKRCVRGEYHGHTFLSERIFLALHLKK